MGLLASDPDEPETELKAQTFSIVCAFLTSAVIASASGYLSSPLCYHQDRIAGKGGSQLLKGRLEGIE